MVRYVSTYDQFKENPVTSSIGLDLPVDCPICQESSVDCYRLGQHVYKSHKNLPIDIRKVFIVVDALQRILVHDCSSNMLSDSDPSAIRNLKFRR
ncbi:hypothetical protein PENTCL1PPCAC_23002 [Pristionchus entomophagus]|uniref:C2H2-type domain-containing protein n=1 Tax=Pristionchus entomophagus TaxID=358040 RepID=A0AAV5U2K4_9BILA|nr:hypothetical protein PENTCL1PPCAC_23002 [Pristionchus entomophagus]